MVMADSEEETVEVKKKRKPLWLWLALGGGLVVVLAGGGYVFMQGQGSVVKKPVLPPPHYITLDPFVSNLTSTSGLHYIQVTIELKTRDPNAAAEVAARRPEIRNAVLNILAEQNLFRVIRPQGHQALRGKILHVINAILGSRSAAPSRASSAAPVTAATARSAGVAATTAAAVSSGGVMKGPISGVYFTAFVVQ